MFPTDEVAGDTATTLLFALTVLGLLILAGVLLRLLFTPLRKLFIPAALIGGLLGAALGPYGAGLFPEGMTATWSALPGILITVVFAPMLIGVRMPNVKQSYRLIAPQLLFGYIGDLLMIGVPMLVCAALLMPLWNVDAMFGTIVEIGWPGGHGTAGGMAPVYTDLGWADGGALALAAATVGLIFGIVMGMVLINIGARRGDVPHAAGASDAPDLLGGGQRPDLGTVTLNKDLVNGLAFHGALIAVAVFIGWVLQSALELAVPGMPLFPLAMIGGALVQAVIGRTRLAEAVDPGSLRAIQGAALDLLVVAAVASVSIPVVLANIVPLALLMLVAAAVAVGYFYWAGPRMFRESWFEHAIVNFGTLTAVSSVGLMLLRTADPDLKTDAARAYALRAPFLSPFLGGGLITALLPMIAVNYGAWALGIGACAAAALLWLLARLLRIWQAAGSTEKAAAASS
ncbi:sodium/glutamate symporter [Streptomonospora wellingtoniae]|uniref:Sodium:glutamate symporter n=1 Tax=Streptomonospora wellingtoniae TaxID=3075544 RepID=A0ABU2KW91_9ACTN|nr:sodium:glutamate symporter [Streptomonospora sp. DSM 45055]MDT0303476.1 sodium:glutamate symporter [Streptomonospora sp. DSM 45055]